MRLFAVPEVLFFQEVPSDEVKMVPELPTKTNFPVELLDSEELFEQEMSVRLGRNLTVRRRFVVKEVILVHDIPSEEVSMIPLSPTVTNVLFPWVTPFNQVGNT